MITNDQVAQLDLSWDLDQGFLGKLRQGIFDERLYQEFMILLKSISLDDELVSKDVVRLLWYIPLFMEWQKERIQSTISLKEYILKKTEIENHLERILGLP